MECHKTPMKFFLRPTLRKRIWPNWLLAIRRTSSSFPLSTIGTSDNLQGFFPYNDDWYTEYSYRFSLYAYDKETASFRSYTVNGQGSKEAVDLNNPDDILRPAVKRLLDEFPYKRIPGDRPHSSSSINKSLSVSTTNGGAKIYKSLDGAVSI